MHKQRDGSPGISKEQSTLIFKTNFNHGVISFDFLSQILEKIMDFNVMNIISKIGVFLCKIYPFGDIVTS